MTPDASSRVITMHCGDGIAVAEVGPVCVVIWRDEVTPARFARQSAGLARVVAHHPAAAAFLYVVEPHVQPPSEEMRKASSAMVKAHQGRLKSVGGVIEARGFMGALTRSVLSGMATLVGRQHPALAFFANVNEAAKWLSQHVQLDPHALELGVADLRGQLDRASAGGREERA